MALTGCLGLDFNMAHKVGDKKPRRGMQRPCALKLLQIHHRLHTNVKSSCGISHNSILISTDGTLPNPGNSVASVQAGFITTGYFRSLLHDFWEKECCLGSKGDLAQFARRNRGPGGSTAHTCRLAPIVKSWRESRGSDSEGIWQLSPTEQWRGGCDEREEDTGALATSWSGWRGAETRQGNGFHMKDASLFSHSKTIVLSITSHSGYIDVLCHCHYSASPLYVISLAPQWAPTLLFCPQWFQLKQQIAPWDAAVCCLLLLGGDLRRL